MLWTYCLQAYAGLATVEGCHEAPALVLDVEGLALCLEFCIQLRQLLPEIIQTALEVFVWYEEVLFYVILFYTVACFTREDNQLAYNVHTAQVNTWIWFAITFLFGETNGFREWYDTRDSIKDKVERTRQNCLNLKDFVTRVAQVVDSSDDRKTSTYVGFKTEYDTTLDGGFLQSLIVLIFAGSSYLVGCDDAHVVLQKTLVETCHILACSTVHEYAVEDIHIQNLFLQGLVGTWF